jgi:type II secretory ATPase GspE/PulE/Tfp pilus assembly ATPase PilB-like protein
MRTLWQNGLSRALSGQTTIEETIRVLAADMM